ncbi:MAG: MATE family efflux transporter [Firmicutes bacterium]|nr:MATE family efflux transporter [Bacillota bacterium]
MLPLIWTLAWPTMLEQLMQTAVQYIDLAMVGSLGTQATAAVGSTTTINWLLGSSLSALSIGFLAYISQAIGAEDWGRARRAVGQSVLMVLLAGSLFTVLTLSLARFVPTWMQVDEPIRPLASRYFFVLYTPMLLRTASIIFGTVLRAAGDTKTPMRVGVLVNGVNVLLNFLLIYPTRTLTVFGYSFTMYGAGQGVVGAATASAVAFAIGGVCITVALYRHPHISFRGVSIRPDRYVLAPCLQVALPNMLQRFGTSLGYVAFAAMINSLGDVATAAHTIANTVESLFYIPAYGMQTAAATLAGNALGARDKQRLQDMSVMMLLIEVALMLVSGAALFAVAPLMMRIFSKSMEVIALGAVVLRMVAVSEPFYGVSIIIEGMLLGMGNTKTPFVYNIIGMWGVRNVGTLLCTQIWGMGLVSAWACMILHNLLLFVLFSIYYKRGKWNPLNRPVSE